MRRVDFVTHGIFVKVPIYRKIVLLNGLLWSLSSADQSSASNDPHEIHNGHWGTIYSGLNDTKTSIIYSPTGLYDTKTSQTNHKGHATPTNSNTRKAHRWEELSYIRKFCLAYNLFFCLWFCINASKTFNTIFFISGFKCEDLHPNCADFAKRGECSNNPGWMGENCKKSCGSKLCDKEPVRPLG